MKRSLAAFAALVASCAASSALAQDYPNRPLRMIVPFAPGGAVDVVGRVLSRGMERPLGQPIVVENRAGAGTLIGTEAVAKAAPDGYTLLTAATNVPGLAIYTKDLSFDVNKDLVSIALVAEQAIVLAASPKAPFATLAEMIAYARANPGKLNFASTGPGTLEIYLALFEQQTGGRLQSVLYKGAGPYTTALLAGEIELAYLSVAPALGFAKEGRIKPLAVTGRARLPELPGVPTFYDAGITGHDTNWFGLMAPGGTPRAIVSRLNAAALAALKEPETREGFAKFGVVATGSSAEEMQKMLADTLARWTAVAKSAGIRPQKQAALQQFCSAAIL
jgi:tripartite-type tricarboxylate transporter receptor subunit TctC